MRENLQKNEHLNNQYIIQNCIGKGASCLVYDALYVDDLGINRQVRIKELFPVKGAKRENKKIIWENEQTKENYFADFQRLYKRQIYFQNMLELTNSSANIQDKLLEANNTKYMIMDVDCGITFEKYIPKNMNEIFEICLSLAKVVQIYHNKGFLLLDLKPENFLKLHETNQLIKYLDFDSIMQINQLQNASSISFSKEWAAPELLGGNLQRISYGTDLYSIGAIAFSKLFNQEVTPSQRSIARNLDYANSTYSTNVNPKAFKYIATFFKKTLNSNINRRYENCEQLIQDLEKIVELTKPNSISLCSVAIDQRNVFVGRLAELKQIDDAFNAGKHVVYLNGCGGIGKTELAKQYAILSKHKFHTIIYGKYKTTLKDFFNDDHIFNFHNLTNKDCDIDTKIKLISEIVDEDTLIIVDNLDVFHDEYLNVLLSLNCKLLITTRAYLSDLIKNNSQTEIINISTMNQNDLMTLFKEYYTNTTTNNEDAYITKIIQYVGGLSLMIPIIAKQMMLESTLPSQMYQKLIDVKLKGISNTFIAHYKDHNLINDHAYNQALNLFDIFSLNQTEKNILYVFGLFGDVSIDRKTLAFFTGLFEKEPHQFHSFFSFNEFLESTIQKSDITSINSLIQKGFFQFDAQNNIISCHNIIRELALYSFNYTLKDIPTFTHLIHQIIDKMFYDRLEGQLYDTSEFFSFYDSEPLNPLYTNELDYLLKNILSNIPLEDENDLTTISNWALQYSYISFSDFEEILDRIQKHIRNNKLQSVILLSKINLYSRLLTSYKWKKEEQKIQETLQKIKQNITILNQLEANFELVPYIKFYINNEISLLNEECLQLLKNLIEKYMDTNDLDYEELLEQINHKLNSKKESNISSDETNDIEENIEDDNTINFKNIYELANQQLIDSHISPYNRETYDLPIFDYDTYNSEFLNTYFINKQYNEIPKTCNPDEIPLYTYLNYLLKNSQNEYLHTPHPIETKIYAYLVQNNSYMFLHTCLNYLNSFSSSTKKQNLNTFFFGHHIEETLESFNKPELLLEKYRLFCENFITIENNTYSADQWYIINPQESIANFLDSCEYYARIYNDADLLNAYFSAKKLINPLLIKFEDYELQPKKTIQSKVIWNSIRYYFDKINKTNPEYYNSIKMEIIGDSRIPEFYKEKLLDCFNIEMTMFDAMNIEKQYTISNYTASLSKLEHFLHLEKQDQFTGIEKMINLCQICFQYTLLNNNAKELEYIQKIIHEFKNDLLSKKQCNYLLFNACSLLITSLTHIDCLKDNYNLLIDYICNDYLLSKLPLLTYETLDLIKDKIESLLQLNNQSQQAYQKCFNELEKTFIGTDHLDRYSDRLEDIYTEKKKEEYISKCNQIIQAWENEVHTKDEYQTKYKEIFDEIFPDVE